MKICKTCGKERDLSEFYYRRRSCKDCVRVWVSTYQKSNRDKINCKRRATRKKNYRTENSQDNYQRYKDYYSYHERKVSYKTYNTEEQAVIDLMDSQRGCCYICGESLVNPESKRNYCIDHDHTTGRVRGLLCPSCNCGLGFLKDRVDFLYKAIEYLSKD